MRNNSTLDYFCVSSWRSTLLFSALVFVPLFLSTTILLSSWLPDPQPGDDWAKWEDQRESLIMWSGLTLGFINAALAGWLWRSPPLVKFHALFISGVLLLVTTLAYVWHVRNIIVSSEDQYVDALEYKYGASPLIALYFTALAFVLILSALCNDRRS